MNPRSSEDARREAEHHRREISETLDALSEKINHTVQQAEYRVNRPLNWVRENPFTALAISVAAGFLLSGASSRGHRRKTKHLKNALEEAYFRGRYDATVERPVKSRPDWKEDVERLDHPTQTGFGRNLLLDLAHPLLRSVAAGLATAIGIKLTGRKD